MEMALLTLMVATVVFFISRQHDKMLHLARTREQGHESSKTRKRRL